MEAYQRLEQEWAKFNNLDPANVVVCSSGTAALHLALESLEIDGGGVGIPDYTMIACARAATLAGLDPTFIDCNDKLLMDVGVLEEVRDLKAVMAVHVYGRRCNMDSLARLCSDKGWWLIEDAAEAHGVMMHSCTDAMCTSYYRNKIIAGEEGGAVAFKDSTHAAVARELRSLGFTAAHDFRHRPRGHNYRLANCLAKKALESLEVCDFNLRIRRDYEGWYDEACPAEWRMPPRDAPWVYDVRVPELTRPGTAEAVRALNAEGIEARMGFLPMSLQLEYGQCRLVSGGTPPKSHSASREVMYLPLTPGAVTRQSAARSFEVIKSLVTS